MQPLAHYIYSSVATPLFRDDGVEELLAQARTANAEADITGMQRGARGYVLTVIC